MYACTKRYPEICVAHRNWRSGTHCSLVHGYARTVELTFEGPLDQNNWVVDLGNLRFIKEFLYEEWDHRLLISDDDPLLADFKDLEKKGAVLLNIMDSSKGYGPSLEQSCLFIADFVREKLASIGATYQLKKVEIWEKGDNRSSLTF